MIIVSVWNRPNSANWVSRFYRKILPKSLLSFFFYVKCLSLLGKIEMKQFLNFPWTFCLVNNFSSKLLNCFVLKPHIKLKVLDVNRKKMLILPKDLFRHFTSTIIHRLSNQIEKFAAKVIKKTKCSRKIQKLFDLNLA